MTPLAKIAKTPERGAALVSTLLIAALLLAAGGMLILTTSMTGTNTIDAAAEMQAYYAAEAGLQATLNVLRGGSQPNPLFVANPVGSVATENIINFRKALTRNTSNLASDPTSADIRLSRWLTYNYTSPGATYQDRVALSPGYPLTGGAYNIQLDDPDDTPGTRPPQRMIIESTGYGPRNARKTLSMMVSANGLNITVPAALVIRGHDNANTDATIDLGNSNAKTYSGVDYAGIETTKSSLAVSYHDLDIAQAAYAAKPGTVANPKVKVLDLANDPTPTGFPADDIVETPWFLESADAARQFLVLAENLANSCVAPGSPCQKRGVILNSLNGAAGSTTSPQFTIVKGDCTLTGGAGLLIVTGTLIFEGAGPNFDGLILVLGGGTLIKQGGGNRDIFGSIMVARFGPGGGFLAPTFNYAGGGGTSNLQYNSTAVLDAIVMPGATVLGVVEKLPEL